jgi:hypothetical protein
MGGHTESQAKEKGRYSKIQLTSVDKESPCGFWSEGIFFFFFDEWDFLDNGEFKKKKNKNQGSGV